MAASRRLGGLLLGLHNLLMYLFLYLPILILVALSFNQSRFTARWTGFTWEWYVRMAQNASILLAAKNSLVVAAISTVVSTVLGTLTAFALHRRYFVGRVFYEALMFVPVVIPEVVMGISLLVLFARAGFQLGLTTVTLAHITFSISFVAIVVRARLSRFDQTLVEAAMDLGASPWEAFRRVTFPLVFPGILAGALMAFTLSIDDFVITFFTAGPGSTTLPLLVYGMVRLGVSPEVNALSTVMLLVTLSVVLAAQFLQRGLVTPQPVRLGSSTERG